jgi:hypothetical protein
LTPHSRCSVGAAVVAVSMTVIIGLMTPTRAMAQASPFTQVSSSPFGPVVVVSTCTGEAVTIQGTERSLIHVTFDASGGGHFRFHTGQHGFGVGVISGKQYTFASTAGSEANFPGTSFEFTQQMRSSLITAGPNNNQVLHSTVHVTFNANGDFSSTVDNFSADCQ